MVNACNAFQTGVQSVAKYLKYFKMVWTSSPISAAIIGGDLSVKKVNFRIC